MASSATKRRSKRQSQDTSAAAEAAPAPAPASSTQTSAPGSLGEQIERAEKAVTSNYVSTLTLHHQWRTYLMRLSYLVVILAFHQTQGPMMSCLKDLKAAGVPGKDAIKLLFVFSLSDVLAIVFAAVLALFLTSKVEKSTPDEFGDMRFLLANALPLPIMGLRGMQDNSAGCIEHPSVSLDDGQMRSRNFPVILVFHVIAVLCYMFMQGQIKHHRENLLAVQKLRQDLEEAEARGSKKIGGEKKAE